MDFLGPLECSCRLQPDSISHHQYPSHHPSDGGYPVAFFWIVSDRIAAANVLTPVRWALSILFITVESGRVCHERVRVFPPVNLRAEIIDLLLHSLFVDFGPP